jgi:hypothetical protein
MDTLFFNPGRDDHNENPDHEVHSWDEVIKIL